MRSVRGRLSIMMFLQYFVWGSWGVEIGGYMSRVLKFTGNEISWVYSSTAIAAMISPLFMGYVADRWLATEKVLAILHLAGAVLLAVAAQANSFEVLFPVMIAYALFYMPTLALTNSISFENVKDAEKEFPLIRVFGTLGWIVSGWVVGFVLRAEPGSALYPYVTSVFGSDGPVLGPSSFLFMAAGSSVLLGLFCLLLPHTPPKRNRNTPQGDRRGIFSLLAEPSFLVFVIASFLICIPLAFYYNLANVFLGQIDAPYPTALQTVGQISEVGFMALMPWFIVRMGVKKLLAVGMLAWVVRYVFFASLDFPLVFIGLLLHGICYDFFFVGSQIYVDNKADETQRASAQSFLAFITLGVAMFIGAKLAGYTMDAYPAPVQVKATDQTGKTVYTTLPDWDAEGKTGLARELEIKPGKDMTFEGLVHLHRPYADRETKVTYRREDLQTAIEAADRDGNDRVTRQEWRSAQAHDWTHIWIWPAGAAGLTLLFFWFGFRDRVTPALAKHG